MKLTDDKRFAKLVDLHKKYKEFEKADIFNKEAMNVVDVVYGLFELADEIAVEYGVRCSEVTKAMVKAASL